MNDLNQLRREAGRLRTKAGAPVPAHVLAGKGEIALRFLIRDARKMLKAKAEEQRVREWTDALLN